jgi:putative (di)nucleoside polyphosphate hydrolase
MTSLERLGGCHKGGIDRGETPERAAVRELNEEIGTDNAEVIAESSGWFYYDLPEDLAKKAWGGRWRGQRQVVRDVL